MRVIGLIPARGGSKGVPRKNVRPLGGKPLLWYTADAARASTRLARVVLTTDDEEIAALGRQYGLDVPFLRPAALAADDTPTLPVVRHAITALEASGEQIDAICLLQPTAPFRSARVIDGCVDLLARSAADAVLTVAEVPHEYNPHWVYFADAAGALRLSTGEAQPIPRRQSLPKAFHRDGSVYLTRRDVVMQQHSLYGERVLGFFVDSDAANVSIDTAADWARAEAVLEGQATWR
jgi:CMP-N,N'-diacetyllegionaminic acid synthase